MNNRRRDVVLAWVDAFNRRDAEAAARLYAPDAVNEQVAEGATVGRHAIRDGLVYFFNAFPDNVTRPENLLEDGEWVALEWSRSGSWRGEFAGHAPNGRSFQIRRCGFFRIVDGQIQHQRGYWDRSSWFGRLGIPIG